MLAVKICGLTTSQSVESAINHGADYVGFVFFEKSPRHLSLEQARSLRRAIKGGAKLVAVSVNADDEYLNAIIEAANPDYLQLHGQESPERVKEIANKFGRPIIKALSVSHIDDLGLVSAYQGCADKFLFDTKDTGNSGVPGGNGVPFDWSILQKLDKNIDYMLSGGLNITNVLKATAMTGAKTIDVSSGVETGRGRKDLKKIEEFLTFVKNISVRR